MSSIYVPNNFLSNLIREMDKLHGPYVCFIDNCKPGDFNANSIQIYALRSLSSLKLALDISSRKKEAWIVQLDKCTSFTVETDGIYASGVTVVVRIPLLTDRDFSFNIFKKFVKLMEKDKSYEAEWRSSNDDVHHQMYQLVSILSDQQAFGCKLTQHKIDVNIISSIVEMIKAFFSAQIIENTRAIRRLNQGYKTSIVEMIKVFFPDQNIENTLAFRNLKQGYESEQAACYAKTIKLLNKGIMNICSLVSNSITNIDCPTSCVKNNHYLDWAIEIKDRKLIYLFAKSSLALSWELTTEQRERIIDIDEDLMSDIQISFYTANIDIVEWLVSLENSHPTEEWLIALASKDISLLAAS